MKKRFATLVTFALVLGLGLFAVSCGDDEEEQQQNSPPTADAGDDQTVGWELDTPNLVTLDGSGSRDGDGRIVTYEWTRVETDGTDVTLLGADTAQATFSTRPLGTDEVLTFRLTVTDNEGATGSDEVEITIAAADLTAAECVALGGHCWNNWTKTAAGGSGSLPTPETNSDYARCKACHGWDQLGTDGGYVRRSRKETRPNAGAGDTLLTVSRNVSGGGFSEGDIIMDGIGRGWDEGTLSWDGGTPEGYAKGNEHPDFSLGDNLPTDVQIDCLVEFLNDPGSRANQVFSDIDPSFDPVAYTLIAGASAPAGETFYNTNCLGCHGTPDDVTGGPVAGGPEGGLKAFLEGDGKPSEFAHKARWGETGTIMTRAAMGNPTAGDVADVIAYLESYEPADPCDPDPCQEISDAVADSCTAVGESDFTCDCDSGFIWDDSSNTCEEEAVDPCDPDPCQGIPDAVAGSCTDVGGGDFTCDCDSGLFWDVSTNTCGEDPAIASGRADYDARCASCHAAGSHDPDGFAGDLAGKGDDLVSDLSTLNPAMAGLTMTQQEMDDMAAFLDSLEEIPVDPCDPDPCQGIPDAVAGSCTAVGQTDFTCGCDAGFEWNDTGNTCDEVIVDPCDPDPCQGIPDAVAGSCTAVGETDFTCGCDAGFEWNDTGNTCDEVIVDPCDPDPCQGIPDAVAGSCTAVGQTDFICGCDAGFVWDAPTNTCGEDPAIALGRADYDARCAGCHAAGTHDPDGFAGDLAGKGGNLVPDLSTINPAMSGITMTQQEMDDMAAFLDSL